MPGVIQRSRSTTLFWGLMVLALVLLLLPGAFTDGLKHVTQLLVPLQAPLYQAAQAAARRLDAATSADDPQALRLQREVEALRNQVVALTGQLEALRWENSRLRGLRERYVPPGLRVVPARVITRDLGPWRDSLLLSRGAARGIRHADPVASRTTIASGSSDGVAVGHLVLASEVLIGQIDHVSPFTSRMRMFSDPGVRTEVRVGRVSEGRFQELAYPCILVGRGDGRMIIEDVPLKYIDANAGGSAAAAGMRAGDLVVSPPDFAALPAPMAIGRVAGFERDARKRLVATVRVDPLLHTQQIDHVFIVASAPVR